MLAPHPQCLRGVTANILKCRTLDLFFFFAPNDRRRTDLTNFLNCQPSYMLESLGFVSVRFLQKQHFFYQIFEKLAPKDPAQIYFSTSASFM